MTMRQTVSFCAIFALVGSLGSFAPGASFYPITSASSSTGAADLWPASNLVQGPGVGFGAAEPHNKTASGAGGDWVTGAPAADYYTVLPAPVIMVDLGGDVDLTEISTWGYSNTNGNGVRDFTLKFATEADGPGGVGTSITFNPLYSMALDPTPRLSFEFGETVNARYVELTALDNFFGAIVGGDRVGMGEIAFESPPSEPEPPSCTGILVQELIADNNANPFNVATPDKMTDNSGLNLPVNEGDSLGAALSAIHLNDGFAESWVTNDAPPDYFATQATPEFVWDLGIDVNLDAIVLWQYQNSGGGDRAADDGSRVGNHARTIELRFNTHAQGSATFAGAAQTVTMAPFLDTETATDAVAMEPNAAQAFTLGATARYVQMRVTDNHFGDPDGFGVHPTIGGDRVGIGEVRFHGTVVPEPSSLVLIILGSMSLLFSLRYRQR